MVFARVPTCVEERPYGNKEKEFDEEEFSKEIVRKKIIGKKIIQQEIVYVSREKERVEEIIQQAQI
jgi:hypothetical protein